MRRSTATLLACPTCRSDLHLHAETGEDLVETGSLACATCQRSFVIEDGIPRFIQREQLEGANRGVARFYDRIAPIYGIFVRASFVPMGGERRARAEILDRLELTGGPVLEVSVGPGVNLPYLFESPAVGEVFGLDISAGQLARCHRLISQQDWPVELLQATAEALPFQDDSFDSVFHIGGINFFSGKRQAIAEMMRVARPGSKVVIADEAERVARMVAHLPGFSGPARDQAIDLSVPVNLVPDGAEDLMVHDIWQAHGQAHGYCLEFRKPR